MHTLARSHKLIRNRRRVKKPYGPHKLENRVIRVEAHKRSETLCTTSNTILTLHYVFNPEIAVKHKVHI